MSTFSHPDDILASLIASSASITVTRTLNRIHELCLERFEAGEKDFGIPAVGKLLSDGGVLRSINSSASASYRELIGAWQRYADCQYYCGVGIDGTPHPDEVLLRLLARDHIKSHRMTTLREIHEICLEQYQFGSLDFKASTIGKLCADREVLAEKSIFAKGYRDCVELINAWDNFARPWFKNPPKTEGRSVRKSHDTSFDWVLRDFPQFAAWRSLAADWVAGCLSGLSQRIAALTAFFENYLTNPAVPKEPADLLRRGIVVPDFRSIACPKTSAGAAYNNRICEFFDWILLRDFCEFDDHGDRVVSPAFRNPFQWTNKNPGGSPPESVRSPLPYGYIQELRGIIAAGPNFSDWTIVHNTLGADVGELGAPSRVWFAVDPSIIDKDDPDCVWRTRDIRRGKKTTSVTEMWSPVRWVAVLIKLLLPLRTAQVRLLDSGESDTWKYVRGEWCENDHPMATLASDWQGGVLRKNNSISPKDRMRTLLYINSNKTADRFTSGPNKGYVIPWFKAPSDEEDVFYWLEKLRNWQSKYNPIDKRTSWSELDGRHINLKSEGQLASYPDTCFLFRLAELEGDDARLPVSDGVVSLAWHHVLACFQERLASRGETHADGSPIKLVERDGSGRLSSLFPLHSLRVSLITALALEGEVPFAILQKLVGHSRLVMTLYYTKPGEARVQEVLTEAAKRMEESKERSIHAFLLDTEHDKLVNSAICNSKPSLAIAIPEHPTARNAAGWMLMHHGLCLVGGNTSELEDNRKLGGCYNGGPDVGTPGKPAYSAVPGGSRNCVRCRWFVTEPHYLPALAAHFNNVAYHFDEARNKSINAEQEVQRLKRIKARAEAGENAGPFMEQKEYLHAQRIWETAMKRFGDLAEDLVACWRLIERCKALLTQGQGGGNQLVLQGGIAGVDAVFEEVESELLQLSGVCQNLEVYPDLEPGKAVIRRSQLLDSVLYNEGLPPLFMTLSESEQLLAGNAFMVRLAKAASPENVMLGQRKIINLMDAGEKLGDYLGVNLMDVLPKGSVTPTLPKVRWGGLLHERV